MTEIEPPAVATDGFSAEAFARHLATQSNLPAWWTELKRTAWARFAALPTPARTDECWRFSNIKGLKVAGYTIPAGGHKFSPDHRGFDFAASLAFGNNHLADVAGLSPELAAKGVVVTTLREAAIKHPKLLRDFFMANPVKLGSEKFAALHAAFVQDGAFVFIPKGVEVAEPIFITHLAAGANTAVFPHTLVIAEENSKATVVDFHTSAPGGAHFISGINDFHAGAGAQLTYLAFQQWSPESLSFQSNSTALQRDARLLSVNMHLGGRQSRHELYNRLQGPGASAELLALTIASGEQEFDQRTYQDHLAPHATSNLLYKNALLDNARTIFAGMIRVAPCAEETDAYQQNRNLLLNPAAEADSLPGLEILNQNVRCTHGATTSRLDPEELFYLRSRGLPRQVAYQLLVFGFFEEVIRKVENAPLAELLRRLSHDKFARK
jgi:Fe-S cluster assembly protein SufD